MNDDPPDEQPFQIFHYAYIQPETGQIVQSGTQAGHAFMQPDIEGLILIQTDQLYSPPDAYWWDGEAQTILAREAIAPSLDRTQIVSDGQDAATLAGLPDPCRLAVGQEEVVVSGGEYQVRAVAPGRVVVTAVGRHKGGPWTVEAAALSEFKARRHQEVNAKKQAVFAGGFVWSGKRWDTNEESRANLTAVITGLTAGIALPEGFFWTSADNEDVTMDAEALGAFAAAMTAFGQAIHIRNRQLKLQIDAAETLAAVMAVDIHTGWPLISTPDFQAP